MKSELILRETLSDVVFISDNKTYRKLQKENIQFIEAQENAVMVHSIKGSYMQTVSMGEFMNHFTNDHEFVRISDTMVVNLNYVDSIIRFTLFMGIRDFRVAEQYREAIFGLD